jgi:V/A-type H+-transporting ATPase subunit C
MPVTGVFHYAGIHTRVRALYSTLLSQPEMSDLIQAASFNSLVDLLRRTVYGPYLVSVEERVLTPRRAAYQVKSQMAKDYHTVIKSSPERITPLLHQYYRSFEVDNLKAVLRGIFSGYSWDRVRYVLFPMGAMSSLPAEAMIGVGSIPEAVELLRGGPYYHTLAHAMERYNVEQSLFPLEVALDLSYWREIWQDVNQLPNPDREHALRILGSLLDMNNLMWAIRYRIYYDLSEEEVINYTLPFGYRVRDQDIRAIAAGSDIPQVVERIYPNLTDLGALLSTPRKGLPELEVKLLRQVVAVCKKSFIGYPFHIGIPLAFLVLKEMEVQDLIVLIEAKSSQMTVEEFRQQLLAGAAPGGQFA